MVKIRFIVLGETGVTEVEMRWCGSIIEAAETGGISLPSLCKGCGVCGRCRVRLVSGEVDGERVDGDVYLACRTRPLTDIEVEIFKNPDPFVVDSGDFCRGLEVQSDRSNCADNEYGCAIDLGTTSIAGVLVNLKTGDTVSVSGTPNPQAVYGDDVISRIVYGSSAVGLQEMSNLVQHCIGRLVERLISESGISTVKVKEILVSGNPAMAHIFLGLSPSSLGTAPYKPLCNQFPSRNAGSVGFQFATDAVLDVLPCVSGYIGGDAIAGIVASGMHASDEIVLLIDLGTNGEVVLGNRHKMMATSAAAGPAFEGGRIEMGMRASHGAVESVLFDGDLIIKTIGDKPAVGICGSGLISLVAGLLNLGLIGADGKFVSSEKIGVVPDRIKMRIVKKGRSTRFYIQKLMGDELPEVYITEKDISELQLAVASIRAAIEVLLNRKGINIGQVDRINIGGAFGLHLEAADLIRLGLLPGCDPDRVKMPGNTSLQGALALMVTSDRNKIVNNMMEKLECIELAGNSEFENKFIQSIPFEVG